MSKIRVFISYDLDHDNDLKIRLIDFGTRDGSPFAVSDWSIRELAADWRDKASKRISHVDLVFVICGEHTDTASSVNNEIAFAREAYRPYFLPRGQGRSLKETGRSTRDRHHLRMEQRGATRTGCGGAFALAR